MICLPGGLYIGAGCCADIWGAVKRFDKRIALKNRTRKYAAVVALGVAFSLGAGAVAGAGAYWKDSAKATEVIIEPGNLDINEVGSQSAVRDISADGIRNGTIVDLSKDKMVPGDTWVRDIALDVALDGKNMLADFKVDPKAKGTGELLADSQGVKFTTAIFKADDKGAPMGKALASGNLVSTKLQLWPKDVTKEADGKADYVLRIKADFDKDTPFRVRAATNANLAGINGQLIQIKEAK